MVRRDARWPILPPLTTASTLASPLGHAAMPHLQARSNPAPVHTAQERRAGLGLLRGPRPRRCRCGCTRGRAHGSRQALLRGRRHWRALGTEPGGGAWRIERVRRRREEDSDEAPQELPDQPRQLGPEADRLRNQRQRRRHVRFTPRCASTPRPASP